MREGVGANADLAHVVITRFNVRSYDSQVPPHDDWLLKRVELFERYCLPGFAAQTCNNFKWVVLLDAMSPAWLRQKMDHLAADGRFEAVYLDCSFAASVVAKVVSPMVERAAAVLTTRVDNDDAVSTNFIQAIQSASASKGCYCVNLTIGAQLANNKLFLRPYTKNPFISLREEVLPGRTGISTVYAEEHFRMDRIAPVKNVITMRPMWLQVVHGGNVANEIVGIRVPSQWLGDGFSLPKNLSDRLFDLLVGMALTGCKVALRMVAKPARWRELWRSLIPAGMGGRRPWK